MFEKYRGFLFSDIAKFWTYQGSLTTPPCTESVTWLVFKKPIVVSHAQLRAFQNLHLCKKEESCFNHNTNLVNNYRPLQPINNRKIKTSSVDAGSTGLISMAER